MFSDFRYAARSLFKYPGATTLVVVTLAIVIGANTTVFSIVNGVFLEPIPFADPDRLVTIENSAAIGDFRDLNSDALTALRDRSRALESIGGYSPGGLPRTVESSDGAARVTLARVTANFFGEVLGIQPVMGRGLIPGDGEPGAPRVALISNAFWQRRFGGDAGVIGRTLQFSDLPPLEIVGVLGPDFRSPRNLEEAEDVWTTPDIDDPPSRTRFGVFGRLAQDATLDTARVELAVIGEAVASAGGEPIEDSTFRIEPAASLYVTDSERTVILVFFGAVLAVLLIGIANLIGFELARLPQFEGAMAIRAAMGASRLQLIRFVLARTLLLGLTGGVLGALLAAASHTVLLANLPASIPRRMDIHMDGGVLAFSIGLSVLASILIALLLALRSSRPNVGAVIHRSSRAFTTDRGYRLFQDGLIAFEAGAALVLMIAAGLLLHNFWTLISVDRGFDPDRIVAVQVTPPDTHRGAAYLEVFNQIAQRFSVMSSVEATSVSTSLPLFRSSGALIAAAGAARTAVDPVAGVRHLYGVTSEYLETMRIPVMTGRMFTDAEDRAGAPVALISESLARTLFPGEGPIGRRIDWEEYDGEIVQLTVIGVTRDIRPLETNRRVHAALYVPSSHALRLEATDETLSSQFVVMRTLLAPDTIEEIARSVEPDALVTVLSMEDRIAGRVGGERFRTLLLSSFAGIAVLLASVGVFTVLSYLVGRRTPEFGIRMTLGATRRTVFVQVFRQALPPAAIGLMIGLGVAYALRESLTAYTFVIQPTDAPTYAIVTLLLSAVILLACVLPARRAARLDPMSALRDE